MKRTFKFGKIAYNGGRKINAVELQVELRKDEKGRDEFSVSCDVWNAHHTDIICGGQCLDDAIIMKSRKNNNRLYNKIVDLWKRNHLNTMHAGTPEQEACLKKVLGDRYHSYEEDCKVLEENNLLVVNFEGENYKYGTKWLYREISAEDMEWINKILDENNSPEDLCKMIP